MKKWLLRNSKGRLLGPLTTEEVIDKISESTFGGDEMISLYPGGEWTPISKEPEFYDHLLSALSGDESNIKPEEIVQDEVIGNSESLIEIVKKKERAKKKERENRSQSFSEQRKDLKNKEIIDLKPLKQIKKMKASKKMLLPFLIILISVVGLIIFWPGGSKNNQQSRFLLPKSAAKSSLSSKDENLLMKKAMLFYFRDTHSNYMKSQERFVRILEKSPKNSKAYAMLCLTYYELWPYSYQGVKELRVLSVVQQRASLVDPSDVDGATCRVIYNILQAYYDEAKEEIESILDKFSERSQPPVAFYYLKARSLERSRDYLTAKSYINSVQRLWPQWLRLFSYEADIMVHLKRYNESARRYTEVLKANPKHIVARLNLAILEHDYFNHPEKAKKYLLSAVKSKERAPEHLKSKAYRVLSQIYLSEGNRKTSLKYAKKSLSYDPFNKQTKKIVLSLGEGEILDQPQLKDKELIYYGDQFLREGDCNSAQAHYKSAFRINRKNSIAAMKAARCLWTLSLSTEAIEWLNKSIRANGKYVEAYILLADYYSQRFKYKEAGNILAKAQALSPTSYEIFRGYSLVEYRRNNYRAAISYAERAIKIYEADVGSYVLLAKSYLRLSKNQKAFSAAAKAIEYNSVNKEVQEVYARALTGVQGVRVGVSYLNKLVARYPLQVEYRIALGNIYLEDEQYREAELVFEQASEINEKSKEAFIGLGHARKNLGNLQKSQNAYFQAAVLDPSDVEPIFQVGLMYLEANKLKKAREQLSRVLSVNPNYPRVHYYMGKVSLFLKRYSEAIKFAEKEKQYNPNLADSYILMAEIYGTTGKYQLCAGEYQKAIKLRPQGADIYVKLSVCYRKSGELSVARTMLMQAKSVENGYPDIQRELGILFQMEGNLDAAMSAYENYLELAPNAIDRDQVKNSIENLLNR